MANKLYDETSVQAIANAIRSKNGSNSKYKISEMADAVRAIQTGIEPVENAWNQIPTPVKNFLDNVTYNPSDYSVSHIAEYAPSTADINNTYPIGKTVETSNGVLDRNGYEMAVSNGNTTVYNDIPNQYTEYVVRNGGSVSQVGTLKPTGFLRQIKCATSNVRDLGGWACDGGTVKYGKLFRGGEFKKADLDIFLNQLGIRHELNLRGKSEAESEPTILRDYVGYTCPEKYVWHTISDKTTWKEIFRCVFDCVAKNEPLFFHCSAGADRTGTVACMIEAILGMSQSDIDKDYELTCFVSGTSSDTQARRRNESDWQGQINAINALAVGTTFRDKVLNWLASMGFTADEINAFRSKMIDGTPDTITLSVGSHSITNNLTNVNNSNTSTSVAKYQSYDADITVPRDHVIESIKITMNGVDVTGSVFKGTNAVLRRAVTRNATNCTISGNKATIDGSGFVATITADHGYTLDGGTVTITMGGIDMSTYYSNGKIAIPNVTGDIVITAVAVKSAPNYTNLAKTVTTGQRLNSSGALTGQDGVTTVEDYIDFAVGNIVRIKGLTLGGYNVSYYNASKSVQASSRPTIPGISYNSTIETSYDEATGVYTFKNLGNASHVLVRFCGVLVGSADDVVVTVNEAIE